MSAERGWISDPQPPKEWHTPGWVKTGGRHFVHRSRQADREALKEENPQSEHEAREPK